MAGAEEQALLEELDSGDWARIQDAVEVTGDWLRTRRVDEPLRTALADRLLRLSSHPKWEVRKAVAHALLFLRHDAFHAAIARIVDDENSWVREAARKTLQRRTELTRNDIHGNDHDDAVLGMLADLEARYGLRAKRAALKIADQLHLQFVRTAYHEIVRIIAPLDASMINLERFQTGADDFVRKPLSLDGQDIGMKIRRCLERAGRGNDCDCDVLALGAAGDLAAPVGNGEVFWYAPDFSEIRLHGAPFLFTGDIQKGVMRILHDAAKTGDPWQSGKRVLAGAGSTDAAGKMSNLFDEHPCWGTLLLSNKRGKYRLRTE